MFAPAGAEEVKSVFCGDMCLGEKLLRPYLRPAFHSKEVQSTPLSTAVRGGPYGPPRTVSRREKEERVMR